MRTKSVLTCIKELKRSVFTTSDIVKLSGKTSSVVVQSLNYLEKQGVVLKIYRGIWGERGIGNISPYSVVPFLFPEGRAYVSFISALHLYGIIEQIPQMITLAATVHTKIVKTGIATYSVHQIAPSFFCGFDWYKKQGDFLIAEPEKALIDCLYLSAYKKNQFAHFPELHFPKSFSFRKVRQWIKKIPNHRARVYVRKKIRQLNNR